MNNKKINFPYNLSFPYDNDDIEVVNDKKFSFPYEYNIAPTECETLTRQIELKNKQQDTIDWIEETMKEEK